MTYHQLQSSPSMTSLSPHLFASSSIDRPRRLAAALANEKITHTVIATRPAIALRAQSMRKKSCRFGTKCPMQTLCPDLSHFRSESEIRVCGLEIEGQNRLNSSAIDNDQQHSSLVCSFYSNCLYDLAHHQLTEHSTSGKDRATPGWLGHFQEIENENQIDKRRFMICLDCGHYDPEDCTEHSRTSGHTVLRAVKASTSTSLKLRKPLRGEFEVDSVLGKRLYRRHGGNNNNNCQLQYRLRWAEPFNSPTFDSWEPVEQLACYGVMQAFEERQLRQSQQQPRDQLQPFVSSADEIKQRRRRLLESGELVEVCDLKLTGDHRRDQVLLLIRLSNEYVRGQENFVVVGLAEFLKQTNKKKSKLSNQQYFHEFLDDWLAERKSRQENKQNTQAQDESDTTINVPFENDDQNGLVQMENQNELRAEETNCNAEKNDAETQTEVIDKKEANVQTEEEEICGRKDAQIQTEQIIANEKNNTDAEAQTDCIGISSGGGRNAQTQTVEQGVQAQIKGKDSAAQIPTDELLVDKPKKKTTSSSDHKTKDELSQQQRLPTPLPTPTPSSSTSDVSGVPPTLQSAMPPTNIGIVSQWQTTVDYFDIDYFDDPLPPLVPVAELSVDDNDNDNDIDTTFQPPSSLNDGCTDWQLYDLNSNQIVEQRSVVHPANRERAAAAAETTLDHSMLDLNFQSQPVVHQKGSKRALGIETLLEEENTNTNSGYRLVMNTKKDAAKTAKNSSISEALYQHGK